MDILAIAAVVLIVAVGVAMEDRLESIAVGIARRLGRIFLRERSRLRHSR